MPRKIISLLLVISTALLSSCKLAVILAEGGEVRSTGSGTCVAGTVCLINVADTNFAETFTAIPNDGWYFHQWNGGARFFCQNSINTECRLSFEGLQGEENIEALVPSSEVFYLMPVFKNYPRATLVDGKPRVIEVDGKEWEWLQPADFTGYSYAQISEICPDGVCSGNLPGSEINLDGYTWASSDEVRLLFHAYEEAGIPIDQHFSDTFNDQYANIFAILRDTSDKNVTFTTAVVPPVTGDFVVFDFGTDFAAEGFGAWFWRPLS